MKLATIKAIEPEQMGDSGTKLYSVEVKVETGVTTKMEIELYELEGIIEELLQEHGTLVISK